MGDESATGASSHAFAMIVGSNRSLDACCVAGRYAPHCVICRSAVYDYRAACVFDGEDAMTVVSRVACVGNAPAKPESAICATADHRLCDGHRRVQNVGSMHLRRKA